MRSGGEIESGRKERERESENIMKNLQRRRTLTEIQKYSQGGTIAGLGHGECR